MNQIPSNVAKITCTRAEVFQVWLKLTREMHNLSDTEIILAAKFLEVRAELKTKIVDESLLDEFLMSTRVKADIREACGIDKMSNFQNMITQLRKKGFFEDKNRISKAFIPNINSTSNMFKMSFIIKIEDTNG